VFESQILEFNEDGDPLMFTSQSEIAVALQAMQNPSKRLESEVSLSHNGSEDPEVDNQKTAKEMTPQQI